MPSCHRLNVRDLCLAGVAASVLVLSGCNDHKTPVAPSPGLSLSGAAKATPRFLPCWGENAPYPVRRLTYSGASSPSASPDGQWLVLQRDAGLAKLSLVNGQIVPLGVSGSEPDWSRTNGKILYRAGCLMTVDPVSLQTSVVRCGGFDDGAVWSPSGNQIAAQGSAGIVLIFYPAGFLGTVPCTDPMGGGGCDGEGPTWSPDGQWIAFEDGMEILKVRSTGGIADPVVWGRHDVTEPAWSPDGKWIAFAMDDDAVPGRPGPDLHIWIVPVADGVGNPRKVTVSDETCTVWPVWDRDPCWSPDSKTIYFSSNRGYKAWGSDIWQVDLVEPDPDGIPH